MIADDTFKSVRARLTTNYHGLSSTIINYHSLQLSVFKFFMIHSVFFIRTSKLEAEAERSYIFLRFEAENVLKMFLNYMVYTTYISVNECGRAEIWYQELLIVTNRDVCHHYICYLDFVYRLTK